MNQPSPKPITETKIPGTEVPDIRSAEAVNEQHKRWMSSVAVSTAVMAAMAAISSMLSGGHLNEAMIEQIRASDQWAFFQAKGIKAAIVEGRIDNARDSSPGTTQEAIDKGDRERLARYKDEQEKIAIEAKARQAESEHHRRQYTLLARAATALQIGIGIAAVALLLRRNVFWIIALTAGTVGAVFLVQGLMA